MVGLSNGLAVLGDTETGTRWDHTTGDAFEGPLKGHKLDWWPIRLTTVEAALAERPGLRVWRSDYRSLKQAFFNQVHKRKINAKSFLPPPFRLTMSSPIDGRLPKLEQGLGVIDGESARFYPTAALTDGPIADDWSGRTLHVELGAIDGVPSAKWSTDEEPPMQLLTRWYGFAFTWPGCDIYGAPRVVN